MTDKPTIKPITADDPEAKSADVIAANLDKLKELFPEAVTEDGVNVDVLNQLIGKTVSDAEEKYGLTWFGKRKARQLALTPSTGTLRPCPEESVDWDTTQNLFIEGDNLEVLKLLQKSYANKVKMIYIDPPYNSGADVVYPDDFQDNIKNYKMLTGQLDSDGRTLSSNAETSGRFHTEWISMMYPRLKLARNLLKHDGTIFISIDDGELATLRLIADDVFGGENFLACFVWKSRQNKDNRSVTGASVDHEYIICYGKRIRGSERNSTQYSNPDNDPRGDWASANMVGIATADRRPNLHYDLVNPATGVSYVCPAMGWRYDRNTMARLIAEDRILWPKEEDGRPRKKAFLADFDSDFTGYSTIVGEDIFTRDGTADMDALFNVRVFDFPKPVRLLSTFVEQAATDDKDIILDFFAGSGTTGHAVLAQNVIDNRNRRYILVQLQEPLDPTQRDQKTAADFCKKMNLPMNIAELTKERLRRAAKAISRDTPMFNGDLGFRAFRLDMSNIRAWNPDPDDLEGTLQDHTEHLVPGRSEVDVLYELLLKLGLDLAVPIETRQIAGKNLHSIGAGTLFACLAESVSRDDVEAVAQAIINWHKELTPEGETTIVFRDSGFVDDVAKSNLAAILVQAGFDETRIRSL